jgi:cadherin 23
VNTLTHELSARVSLDREERANYTLLVQASSDCLREPRLLNSREPGDRSVLRVLIRVRDVNDNAPRFAQKEFTGGVSTDARFGAACLQLAAQDADADDNGKIRYSIVPGSTQASQTEALGTMVTAEPFAVDSSSGQITLNFDPRRDMKGYFEFDVQASDSGGLSDTAKVKVYLLREDQRVMFILRLSPQEIRERLEKFRA